MKEFKYTITDPLGIHARPAGLFVKEATLAESSVSLTKEDKTIDAKRIFSLMSLAVKCGEEVTVTVEGTDEEAIAAKLETFMKENL